MNEAGDVPPSASVQNLNSFNPASMCGTEIENAVQVPAVDDVGADAPADPVGSLDEQPFHAGAVQTASG